MKNSYITQAWCFRGALNGLFISRSSRLDWRTWTLTLHVIVNVYGMQLEHDRISSSRIDIETILRTSNEMAFADLGESVMRDDPDNDDPDFRVFDLGDLGDFGGGVALPVLSKREPADGTVPSTPSSPWTSEWFPLTPSFDSSFNICCSLSSNRRSKRSIFSLQGKLDKAQ